MQRFDKIIIGAGLYGLYWRSKIRWGVEKTIVKKDGANIDPIFL